MLAFRLNTRFDAKFCLEIVTRVTQNVTSAMNDKVCSDEMQKFVTLRRGKFDLLNFLTFC